MTPEIIGADGLDDLNNYLSGEQAKIDAQMMEELESILKPDKMPDQVRLQYALQVAEEYLNRRKYMGTAKWFEPNTEFGIEVCKKHKLFFDATNNYRQVMFRAANRAGKTIAGAFAVATWLDGLYPDWWEGKRFEKPVRIWAAGKTGQTVRDTVQKELLGDLGHFGTGMIPKDRIAKVIMKPGVPGGVDSIQVYNDWGDPSICGFKSYDQRIDAFVGVALDAAWEDEEPPYMVHNETFARLTTTMGVLINTVTPITGLTPYLLNFEKQSDMLGGAERTVALNEDEQKEFDKHKRTKAIVAAGWSDAPWLDEQAKIDLLADTPPHLKESRMTGKPSLGSGSVYPVPLESVLIDNDDFSHKSHYKYIYGIDVGWNKTAIVWGALDPDTDILYIYDEYYMGEQRPEVHAGAIKGHGVWMPGVIDPASRGRSQVDGMKLITLYIQAGLQIVPANNAVEAGIMDVYQRLSSGKLKILKKCRNLQAEYMTYKRDINGKVIKENDHLADALRYVVVELHRARTKPINTSMGSGNGARNFFR